MKKLKVAYVTTYNALDVNSWSGLGYYIAKTVQKHLGEVTYIGDLKTRRYITHIMKSIWYKKILGKGYDKARSELIGKEYARMVEKELKKGQFDLILSPGTIPIAYLDTNIPIVFWTDANFSGMINYYFENLSDETIRDGNKMEKRALDNCSLAIYSSEWAATGAIELYGINPIKVKVIPFGANIDNIPSKDELHHKIGSSLKLLFVGKDWKRKGGEIAFDTMKLLNEEGIEAHLTVVGCVPPVSDQRMKVVSFLNKNKKEDAEILRSLYIDSNFFIMPSRKECYGVVFCEAAAFGLPVLSSVTGGIPTIVKDGVNGYLLPLSAGGKDYAEKIIEIINSGTYEHLCSSSRQRYEEVLNWDTAGKKLREEVERTLK